MLSPGDVVLIDGETDTRNGWTVTAAVRAGEKNYYTLELEGAALADVPAYRITGHVIIG